MWDPAQRQGKHIPVWTQGSRCRTGPALVMGVSPARAGTQTSLHRSFPRCYPRDRSPPPEGRAMGTTLPVLSTRLRLSWDRYAGCCPTLLMPSHPESHHSGFCLRAGGPSSINPLWTWAGNLFGWPSTGASPGPPLSAHVGSPGAKQEQEKVSLHPL